MSIKFHLPDFCGNYKMNLTFIDEIKAHPEYFYDGKNSLLLRLLSTCRMERCPIRIK